MVLITCKYLWKRWKSLAIKIEKRKDIPEPAVKQQHELHRSLRPPHSTWLSCGGWTLYTLHCTTLHNIAKNGFYCITRYGTNVCIALPKPTVAQNQIADLWLLWNASCWVSLHWIKKYIFNNAAGLTVCMGVNLRKARVRSAEQPSALYIARTSRAQL